MYVARKPVSVWALMLSLMLSLVGLLPQAVQAQTKEDVEEYWNTLGTWQEDYYVARDTADDDAFLAWGAYEDTKAYYNNTFKPAYWNVDRLTCESVEGYLANARTYNDLGDFEKTLGHQRYVAGVGLWTDSIDPYMNQQYGTAFQLCQDAEDKILDASRLKTLASSRYNFSIDRSCTAADVMSQRENQ